MSTGTAFDRRLLVPMMLGAVLNPINSSILAVSLVPIGVAFGAAPSQTAWLVGSLYLATAIGQPVVGRLIDVFGPRRLFLAATTLVGVAGVIGMTAPGLGTLIAARVLLGFGTCAGYPAAMYLIRSESRRTGLTSPAGVLTALAVTTQTITVVGPALGGLLITVGGWRATLAVNVPLALAGLILGTRYLPRTPKAATGNLTNPFVDVRLLTRNLPLILTYARSLLAATVSYALLYGVTQWLQDGRGLPAHEAGLVQLPIFIVGLLVSSLTGRDPRIRGKLLVAGAGQVVACGLLLVFRPATPILVLLLVMAAFGVPQGLNSLALQNCVYHQADPARTGSSAGLLRTFMYMGAMAASVATGAFFPHQADTAGLHHLAVFLIAVAAAYLVITVADRSLASVGRPASESASVRVRPAQRPGPAVGVGDGPVER